MKRLVLITGMVLLTLGTTSFANELDELGEINIVDNSAQSSMLLNNPIVGCNDTLPQKELTCAKKPKEAILSKLPTSQQLNTKDLSNNSDMEEIKSQLNSIIKELSQLKKEQVENKNTIEELNGIIEILSSKSIKSSSQKMSTVKTSIQRIKPKVVSNNKGEKITTTLIRKKIKEIEKFEDHVLIEVQSNESLSTYAQYYYNDNTQYYKIYKANKDKINSNFQLIIGTQLTIPLK